MSDCQSENCKCGDANGEERALTPFEELAEAVYEVEACETAIATKSAYLKTLTEEIEEDRLRHRAAVKNFIAAQRSYFASISPTVQKQILGIDKETVSRNGTS